ncbi:MAG TPA: hypothetical protein ENI23_13715 [bacterium]|nr:hypothetical protein [bacterium]
MPEQIHNKVGRPPKYDSPEELQEKILDYFKECPDTKTTYFKLKDEVIEKVIPCLTISGLMLYLGFDSRQSFYAYEKKPEFSYTIKKARTFIEKTYEMQLQSGNPTGAIFALKNFGWTDKQEIEQRIISEDTIIIKHNTDGNLAYNKTNDSE